MLPAPDFLPCTLPLVQAPMAGISTPELAAAVSNAGALGSIAVGAVDAGRAGELITLTRALTDRPFNVNVFCHAPPRERGDVDRAWQAHLAPAFAEFEAAPPERFDNLYASFIDDEAMLTLLIERRPAVVSFHFGIPDAARIRALKSAGITLMASATTPAEAERIEAAGIDVIIAQGAEAGGHRGVFDPDSGDAMIGTLALTRLIAARTTCPVIAAGGLMDRAAIEGVLAAGAGAAQLGTAFIACPESSAGEAQRALLLSERALETRVTSAISGRPARAIVNRFVRDLDTPDRPPVPDYPRAYHAGKALAAAARDAGSHEFDACWAGQGAPLTRALPAAELVAALTGTG
ncbi:nitronate monooxygenase [Kushneria sinocarnis]|uniref:Nitronate monooxygenase n=1 Tax=Kushneria sinocarnis TaxID=595502 RepID=A0A420WWK2_9GAMM|nr:nitronate monooxygenase [Kushneria sinocarnis]RKR03463.1 nitronate monooxygenase [Kushneria sinocarnis]